MSTSAARPVPVISTGVEVNGRWMSLHEHYLTLTREREADVLFVGDSLIEQLGQSEVWRKTIAGFHCLNFGIPGECTQHVLWRLENGELENIRPKVVVLLVGTNNIGHTAEEVVIGIEAIVKVIFMKQPQAHIIVMAIPPKGRSPNKFREKDTKTNSALASSLPKLGDCELLDTPAGFVDSDGHIDQTDMRDFLHFTTKGYRKLCEPLFVRLEEILMSKKANEESAE